MIQPANEINVQKKKRSELDPIWKRIYVERVWRVIIVIFFIFYIVQSITEYFHSNLGALAFAPLIIICGYIFNIINYFFIERYWRRIGQRRIQALQIAQRETLPESRHIKTDANALPVPTTLRLQWGLRFVIGLRLVLALLVLVFVINGIAIWRYPDVHGTWEAVIIISLIFSGGIVVTILLYYFFTGRYQGQTIEITDEGIRTRYMRQERFIRWDEARLFASYGAQGINKNLLVETYELSNEETVVRWSKQQPGLAWLSVQSDDGLKDDWNWLVGRVNSLVVARSGLPLTDIGDNSQLPQWLAQRWTGERREQASKGLAATPTRAQAMQDEQVTTGNTPEQMADVIAHNDPMRRRINNRQMLQAVAIFGIFGLIMLVAGIAGLFNPVNIWLGSICQFFIVAGAFLFLISILLGVALRVVARYWYRVQQARKEALHHPHDFLAATQPRMTSERPANIQMGRKTIVNLLVTLGLGLIFYTILAFPFVHLSNIGLRLLVSIGFALALSLFAAIMGITLSKRTNWQRVSIVNDGIGTRFGGVDSTIRWSDAAFFATYLGTNLWGGVNKKVRIYELASGQTVVRWQGVARIKYMDTEPRMDQQQFDQWQEQLKGYVVEKTGLPLIELQVEKKSS